MLSETPVVRADDRVLVFGGPCSNLQATQAVLAQARRLGIPPARIICTGDLAAYCGEPSATIELVRASGIHVVMGNCDEQLGAGAADCACGFDEDSACNRLAAAWYAHADAQVGADARAWLAGLPRRIDLLIRDARLAVIHGSVRTINQFVFASSPALVKLREMELAQADGVIGGHCGLPFSQVIDGRLWHNPGIVGIPANDGTQRVWFSLLTPTAAGLEIEHCALAYDHETAQREMERAGLPSEYRTALATGIWPSCDVLPYREIRERGVALEPGSALWRNSEAGKVKRRAGTAPKVAELWPGPGRDTAKRLEAQKFKDPLVTAKGEPRARVPLTSLDTLWINTGTLCNITCRNCYIESSPKNDRLVYPGLRDLVPFLDEIERDGLRTREIGFTGGEPFMNPEIMEMLETCLARGFEVIVLTNAMRPMQRLKKPLLSLRERFGSRLTIRVSLDHFTVERHEEERGVGTFKPAVAGLVWLSQNGFRVAVAGRTMWGEADASERAGYGRLFAEQAIAIDASDPACLVLFPEMDERVDVPEITTACWGILHKAPEEMMCATSRMVVKRRGAERAAVVSCTLLPYDAQFELGTTLREASGAVPLNHPHCAKFCVLGGASCSAAPAREEAKAAAE